MIRNLFITQIKIIDKVITSRLEKNETADLPSLIAAELDLANHIEMMDELIEAYPEGVSEDSPEQEEPEVRKARKEQKNRGFYS